MTWFCCPGGPQWPWQQARGRAPRGGGVSWLKSALPQCKPKAALSPALPPPTLLPPLAAVNRARRRGWGHLRVCLAWPGRAMKKMRCSQRLARWGGRCGGSVTQARPGVIPSVTQMPAWAGQCRPHVHSCGCRAALGRRWERAATTACSERRRRGRVSWAKGRWCNSSGGLRGCKALQPRFVNASKEEVLWVRREGGSWRMGGVWDGWRPGHSQKGTAPVALGTLGPRCWGCTARTRGRLSWAMVGSSSGSRVHGNRPASGQVWTSAAQCLRGRRWVMVGALCCCRLLLSGKAPWFQLGSPAASCLTPTH
ncbi:hypothetical protein V8C86DRAFT_2856587 [Haematococcus lacustris]